MTSAFLTFTEFPPTKPRLTKIITVASRLTGVVLGNIRWQTGWRRYVFHPAAGTLFDETCLTDLAKYLAQMMAERRAVIKEKDRNIPWSQPPSTNPITPSHDPPT